MTNDRHTPIPDDAETATVTEIDDADLDTLAGGSGEYGNGRRLPVM
ncbi:hypothetical protein [Actinosynnema sp. NPDC020468]